MRYSQDRQNPAPLSDRHTAGPRAGIYLYDLSIANNFIKVKRKGGKNEK
jgi:hypothetical protein